MQIGTKQGINNGVGDMEHCKLANHNYAVSQRNNKETDVKIVKT